MIAICRHGETKYNTEGRYQGQSDSPLTEKGVYQARLLGRRLAQLGVQEIYASPLSRVRTTLEIALPICDHRLLYPPYYLSELMEIYFGDYEGKLKSEVPPDILHQRVSNKAYHKFPNGESYYDLADRVNFAVNKIKDLAYSNNIAILAHEGVNRVLYYLANPQIGFTRALEMKQPNGVIWLL